MFSTELINAECLQPGNPLPLIIRPVKKDLDLSAWTRDNREFIETSLVEHGAILFRDFAIRTVADFEQFTQAASTTMMEYRERSSPRHEVGDKIYTSTDYPAEQSIFPHNEHSYARVLPRKLFFFCFTPASQNGDTPVADCRRILQRIDAEIRKRFIEKKWMYVRNFGDGFGLPWQTVFQSSDKAVVEEYCRQNLIECEWKDGNRLRTRQVRPAIVPHPFSGEEVWFNHVTFFHASTLEPMIREAMLMEFKEEDLPNHTYYGDGTPIEPSVMDQLRDAYLKELVSFSWQQGDVLLLDNMLTAHARAPYAGPRKILFAMTEPFTRTDI